MTLPSSGSISFNDIRIELGIPTQTPFSLEDAENGTYSTINRCGTTWPGGDNPAAISEWYGYNHAATAETVAADYDFSSTSCAVACALPQAGVGTLRRNTNVTPNKYYATNYSPIKCVTSELAGDGYYVNSTRTTCYYIANSGELQSSTACTTTTTTTTTTTQACIPSGQGTCTVDTDCCNYPIAICNGGTCVEI